MKLIALKNFRNVGQRIKVADPIHADHVHKGAVFEIGKANTYEGLRDESEEDAKLVYCLNAAHCIADANSEQTVKRVMSEVAAEKRTEERQLKATPPPAKYV